MGDWTPKVTLPSLFARCRQDGGIGGRRQFSELDGVFVREYQRERRTRRHRDLRWGNVSRYQDGWITFRVNFWRCKGYDGCKNLSTESSWAANKTFFYSHSTIARSVQYTRTGFLTLDKWNLKWCTLMWKIFFASLLNYLRNICYSKQLLCMSRLLTPVVC